MDLARPEEGLQEAMLGAWTPADSVTGLAPDDLARVPLLIAGN